MTYAGAVPTVVAQPASYIPAQSTIAPQVTYAQPPAVVETITAGAAPITTAYSNNSYIPAAMPATIAAPQVTYAAPQATVVESFTAGATAATYPAPASYIPAQPAMVETVAPQVTYAGAAPQMTYAGAYAGAAPQMTYAGASPATTVAAPASYLPPPV